MKLKLLKLRTVRVAVLPWDNYQYLVVPLANSSERRDRWEFQVGKTIFQIWSTRTVSKSCLKGGRYYSVRPNQIREELLVWLANYWLDGAEPEGPKASDEYFRAEMIRVSTVDDWLGELK